jgi:glutamate racemase
MELSQYQTVVMDWGIGGLSVYREIKRCDPKRSIVYFSDSGTTPYGKLPPQKLESRVAQVCEHFMQRGIREMVIACNAAGTAAPWLRSRYASCGLRIVDVISSGIRMIKNTSFRRLGVIGGRRTILSRIYQRALSTKRRKITGRIAQPLSALIERGELNTPLMNETLRAILTPLRHSDGILLACTHYPAVRHLIQPLVPDSEILDPSAMTAEELVGANGIHRQNGPPDLFLTTGDPVQSRRAARLAFDIKIDRFVRIELV